MKHLKTSKEIVNYFLRLQGYLHAVHHAFYYYAKHLGLNVEPEIDVSMKGDEAQELQISSQMRTLIQCTVKAFSKLDSFLDISSDDHSKYWREVLEQWEVSLNLSSVV